MDDFPRLKFRAGDFGAAAAVLLVAVLLLVPLMLRASSVHVTTAQIYLDGELVREIPLNRDGEYRIRGAYTNVITVRGGKIAVTQSDCPGGDCMRCGWASAAGKSIVCLPNRMEIRLTGEGDVDIATR